MRILIIGWRDIKHPRAGGMELVAYEHAKYFIKKGHKVIWISQKFPDCKEEEEYDGIKVIRIGGAFSTYPLVFLKYLFKLRFEVDAIIENNIGLPYFTPLYAFKPRVTITYHLIKKTYFVEAAFPIAVVAYFIENFLAPIVYCKEKMMAISESTKKEMIKSGYRNIDIVRLGLDHAKYNYKEVKKFNKPHLIYIGGVKKYKRINILVDVLHKLIKKYDCHLDIVGALDFMSGNNIFLEQAKRLGVNENVTFHGYLSEEDKIMLLRKSHIFVTASSKEGWGLVNLEANACGLPVVAMDLPAFRESVSDNESGYLVKTTSEFVAKVSDLLNDPKLMKKMSKDGIGWAKEFTWEGGAKSVINLLEK